MEFSYSLNNHINLKYFASVSEISFVSENLGDSVGLVASGHYNEK